MKWAAVLRQKTQPLGCVVLSPASAGLQTVIHLPGAYATGLCPRLLRRLIQIFLQIAVISQPLD